MLDNVFWATIGLIFLTAIISAFVRARQRDDCLALLHDHHMTLVRADGAAIWGDLLVHARGLEVRYVEAIQTGLGVTKTSYLVYASEMAEVLALCRAVGQLTPAERAEREAQIARRVNPSLLRRAARAWRNAYNTMRDAFAHALQAIIGQVVKSTGSKALASQQKSVGATGKEMLEAAGDAFEPMLEAHIGSSVIMELRVPEGEGERCIELVGYLAEYSDRYIALFNVDHPVEKALEVRLETPEVEAPEGVAISLDDEHLHLQNLNDRPLVVESVIDGSGQLTRVGATLPFGAKLRVDRPDLPVTLRMQWLTAIDVVCPRSRAVVRHAGGPGVPSSFVA